MTIAHLAFDFCTRCQCGHRVDNDDIEGTGTHQHVDDFEGLFTSIGLRDQQLIGVDTNGRCVDRVHGVFGIDVGADAAVALGFSHNVHGKR